VKSLGRKATLCDNMHSCKIHKTLNVEPDIYSPPNRKIPAATVRPHDQNATWKVERASPALVTTTGKRPSRGWPRAKWSDYISVRFGVQQVEFITRCKNSRGTFRPSTAVCNCDLSIRNASLKIKERGY